MNFRLALLGFLYYAPATGYELTKKIFEPIRPTRHVVYRYLNAMLQDGLVEADRVEQEKYPTRNVFHITQKGRDLLGEWYTTYKKDNFVGDRVMDMLWFSSVANGEQVVNLLNQYLRDANQQYQYYQERSRKHTKLRKDSNSELDHMCKSLVYDFILSRYRDNIGYAEKAIRIITDFKEASMSKPLDYGSKISGSTRGGKGKRPKRV